MRGPPDLKNQRILTSVGARGGLLTTDLRLKFFFFDAVSQAKGRKRLRKGYSIRGGRALTTYLTIISSKTYYPLSAQRGCMHDAVWGGSSGRLSYGQYALYTKNFHLHR